MRVAGYVRVSTEEQAKEYGPAAQRETIEAYCRQQGHDVVAFYEDAVSGALSERPGLMDLMEAAKQGMFDLVVVAKLDRLSRDTLYCLWIEKELRKVNVELVSVAEPYRWDDPMQKMMLTIMAAFAEYEKELIKLRLSGGRKAKARQGSYAGGRAAIGYKAERGAKVLFLDGEKAETVRRVFELHEQHPDWSLQLLADQLNREGHTTAQGKQFHKTQVKRILDRRAFYEGTYNYAGIQAQGRHEAIL